MTVTVSVVVLAMIVAYLAVGAIAAYRWAISYTSVATIMLLWPVGLVLVVVGLIINHSQRGRS